MDIRALDKLIQSTESYRIEKTSSTTNTDKFCQAICAFSNDLPGGGQPGYLLIGVNVLVNKPVNEINLFENLILPSRSHTVLTLLQGGAMPQSAILPSIGLSYQTHNVRAYINPLIHNGLITKVPKREHHTRSLWYTLTEKGKRYLQFLSR